MRKFKNQKFLMIMMGAVLFILICQVCYYLFGFVNKDETKHISIVAYGTDTDRWENLKLGAEVACKKSGSEVFMVTMAENTGALEQAELIKREIENGSDAVIALPCDSDKLAEYVGFWYNGRPIVYAETGIASSKYVSADNYQLGVDLAEKIKELERDWIKVAIVADNLSRDSVAQRYQGVYDTITQYTDNVVIWERNSNEANMLTRKYLQRWLVEEAVDVIITLDSETTDSLMDALDNLNKSSKVYSIANTDKAVSYLDHEKIKALEYQDEFAIGYIAAIEVLEEIGIKTPDIQSKFVEAKIVTKSDMYLDENQELLFPFAK